MLEDSNVERSELREGDKESLWGGGRVLSEQEHEAADHSSAGLGEKLLPYLSS